MVTLPYSAQAHRERFHGSETALDKKRESNQFRNSDSEMQTLPGHLNVQRTGIVPFYVLVGDVVTGLKARNSPT